MNRQDADSSCCHLTYLELGFVRNSQLPVNSRQNNLKDTEIILLHGMRPPVPAVWCMISLWMLKEAVRGT
jgi:hypothetical protein